MKLQDFDFRIWDKGEKTLTYASKDWKLGISFSNPQQDYGETESVLHAYYDGEPMCPDDCEVELWTGYKDSKDTRIYENDIIRTDKGEIFSVVADGEITAWGLLDSDSCPCCSLAEVMFESERVEVLGNIHENAELLKKEKVLIKTKYSDLYDSKGFPKY